MRKLLTLILLISAIHAFAQDSLQVYNNQRNSIKSNGMTVLASWAVANIAISSIAYNHSAGSTRSFYQMNTIFNVINLGIATAGYISTRKDSQKQLTAAELLNEQKKTEQIFLINGGLDLVYIGTGVFLKNRGDRNDSDQLRGYGSSVIMQGGFLLFFDSVMYGTEKHNGSGLRKFLAKNPVLFDGKKVGMMFRM